MDHLPPPADDRGPLQLEASWIGVGIAVLVVTARIYTRVKIVRRLSLDDYLMVAALTFGSIATSLTTVSVKSGFGKHITALRPDQIVKAVKYAYIATPFAYLALVLGRVSFAVSLILLIGTTKFRLCLLNALIIGQFVLNITWIGIILGECRPVQKYWNRTLPGRCLDPKVPFSAGYLSSSFNVFTDLVLAILPSVVVSNLNLQLKTKIGLIILMSLGVFNMVAAIITIVQQAKIGGSWDITYVYVPVDVWGVVQTYLAIVVASIPFLRPLFRDIVPFTRAFCISIFHRSTRETPSKKEPYTVPAEDEERFNKSTIKTKGVDEGNLMEMGVLPKPSSAIVSPATASVTSTMTITTYDPTAAKGVKARDWM